MTMESLRAEVDALTSEIERLKAEKVRLFNSIQLLEHQRAKASWDKHCKQNEMGLLALEVLNLTSKPDLGLYSRSDLPCSDSRNSLGTCIFNTEHDPVRCWFCGRVDPE